MDRLSPELRSLVISKFTPKDLRTLLRLSATNRMWYYAVSDDLVWKRLYQEYRRRNVEIPVDELAPYTTKRFVLSHVLYLCIVCGQNNDLHLCDFKQSYMCVTCTTFPDNPDIPYSYMHLYTTQAKHDLCLRKEVADGLPKETVGYRRQISTAVLVRDIYATREEYQAQKSFIAEARAVRTRRSLEIRSKRNQKISRMLNAARLTSSQVSWPLERAMQIYRNNGLNVRNLQDQINREGAFRDLMDKLGLDGRKVLAKSEAASTYYKGLSDCVVQLEKELVGLDKSLFGKDK